MLKLESGETIPARAEDYDVESLRTLFGAHVVVSGLARFRPSRRIGLLEIEHLAPARHADAIWSASPPIPLDAVSPPVVTLLSQDETSGVSAIFGTWPGDESDADLQAALASLDE